MQRPELLFLQYPAAAVQVQGFQRGSSAVQLGVQALNFPVVGLHFFVRGIQGRVLRMQKGPQVALQAFQNSLFQFGGGQIGLPGAETFVPQGGAAAEIPEPGAVLAGMPGSGLFHDPAAQTAHHPPGQWMDAAFGAAAGVAVQPLLDHLEGLAVDDSRVGAGNHDPLVPGQPDGFGGLVADAAVTALFHVSGIGAGGEQPVHGGFTPAFMGCSYIIRCAFLPYLTV